MSDEAERERRREAVKDARATLERLQNWQPIAPRYSPPRYSPMEVAARQEHAWLLRAEGLTLREIGDRLGVTGAHARIMIFLFGRRMQTAMRRTAVLALFHWFAARGYSGVHEPLDLSGVWSTLPLALRQRYWRETDYGKQPPGDDLKQTIRKNIFSEPTSTAADTS